MRRTAFLIYGLANYGLFFAVYAYMAAFFADVLVPKTIDAPPGGQVVLAVVVNVLLILLFGLQHSVMARPGFKRIWTRIVPKPIERSTYMLFSNLAVILLMWQWRPIDTPVWDVQNSVGRVVLWGLFAAGWLMVPAVSLMINHFDLFGVRQVWLHFRGREYTALPFHTPLLYARMRHPLYVGWFLAFWATPSMTAGHLLLALGFSSYILVAVLFEERDLLKYFGRQYAEYQRRVPRFLPSFGGRAADGSTEVVLEPKNAAGSSPTSLVAADVSRE
jgi:protein-S-isoprenylcysteine O-methyltransferase Ste14